MCTLSWRVDEELTVFFNRDELKTRNTAKVPQKFLATNGTHYLSPIDPDGGGTWMFANEHGIVACLLNRWHLESSLKGSPTAPKSRGQIVLALAGLSELSPLQPFLTELSLGAKPYELIAFQGGERRGFSWDGKTVAPFVPKRPLTSSSYQFEKVKAARETAFGTCSSLEDFHNTPAPSSAYTVRMNRPDAQTWSRSQLRVTRERVIWDYWEEFPDLAQESQLHRSTLDRAGETVRVSS